MAVRIIVAGYGTQNTVREATEAVQGAFDEGKTSFQANNDLIGDPAPGQDKVLFIAWHTTSGATRLGVAREHTDQQIVITDDQG
jgi:hypothetical protein